MDMENEQLQHTYVVDSPQTWLELGLRNSWCGPIVCSTHDGVPTTEAEDEAWEDGDDLCIPVIRLYLDEQTRADVEENHAPSVWRRPTEGSE